MKRERDLFPAALAVGIPAVGLMAVLFVVIVWAVFG